MVGRDKNTFTVHGVQDEKHVNHNGPHGERWDAPLIWDTGSEDKVFVMVFMGVSGEIWLSKGKSGEMWGHKGVLRC